MRSGSAENGDGFLHPTAAVAQVEACFPAPELPADDRPISVCVACCFDSSMPHDTALVVARRLRALPPRGRFFSLKLKKSRRPAQTLLRCRGEQSFPRFAGLLIGFRLTSSASVTLT